MLGIFLGNHEYEVCDVLIEEVPSDNTWQISKDHSGSNIYTAITRVDINDPTIGLRDLFEKNYFSLYDKNEWIQFSNMKIEQKADGNYVLSADYLGDIWVKTEKVDIKTGKVVSSTPLLRWRGERMFLSEDISTSPEEGLVIIVRWRT